MDLAFTPEELAFRDEIRSWVKQNLPADISTKVLRAQRLTRDDMQRWAKILGKQGWLGYGWPKQFGGPGWTAVQKHLFEEECAPRGGAQRWTSEDAPSAPAVTFTTLEANDKEGRAVGTFAAELCLAEDYEGGGDPGNCRMIEGRFDTRFFVER